MHPTSDVLIVGGGPAGLAAAIALQQQRITCTVVEAGSPGMEKACGEGLMPDTLLSLAQLGVRIGPEEGHPFCGIRFVNQRHRTEALFPAGSGLGVRRPRLHALLADRAKAAGASILWNSRVKLLDRQSAQVNGEQVRFRWLVGADGHSSSVRRWAGLDDRRKESVRFGFRRHYLIRPWSEFVEVHWGVHAQLYVTPVSADCVCVILATSDRQYGAKEMLKGFPEMAERLKGVAIATPQRGAVTATLKLRRVADETVALLGDASGSADSCTGDGLGVTFRQALALGTALRAGSLQGYEGAHRKIGQLPHLMGAAMLTMDRWPHVERSAISALSSSPGVFSDLLAVHLGVQSLPGFAMKQGPALIWNLLRHGISQAMA